MTFGLQLCFGKLTLPKDILASAFVGNFAGFVFLKDDPEDVVPFKGCPVNDDSVKDDSENDRSCSSESVIRGSVHDDGGSTFAASWFGELQHLVHQGSEGQLPDLYLPPEAKQVPTNLQVP